MDNQILPALGELRLRELTTGTVDRFLKTVAKCSGPSMAKMTRSVLSGKCGLAARHDAINRNPVRAAQVINQPRKAAPVSLTAKEVRQLRALMTQPKGSERKGQRVLNALIETRSHPVSISLGAVASDAYATWQLLNQAGTSTL